MHRESIVRDPGLAPDGDKKIDWAARHSPGCLFGKFHRALTIRGAHPPYHRGLSRRPMRQFDVPEFYQSPIISTVKQARRAADPRKKDLVPSVLDFGPVKFIIPRHFGFCYGVENAIEIAYRALAEHPDKAAAGRIFLLSEMIHNPHVNDDLQARGIRFLRTTTGEQLIPFDELRPDDVVIIPAFGTTLEITEELRRRGVSTETYNTTCPFVEKVWKKSDQIGGRRYTVVVRRNVVHFRQPMSLGRRF
jgi:4-hydroxy-3-methylbut-2-en-1-yl diphosphate reductase